MVNSQLKHLAELIIKQKDLSTRGSPKYKQVASYISNMIESGWWKPGDRMPSEADMAKDIPASLGTIQKALSRLVDQGAIVRKHYRGTFVNGPHSLLGPWHLRYIGDDGKTLLPVQQKVLSIEKVIGCEPWSGFLGDSSFFICIKRLIDVNGEFSALSQFFVCGEGFESLLEMPAEELNGRYIREFLGSRFGTPTLRLVEEVTCEAFPIEVCQILNLDQNSIGMNFHIMSYGYRDKPVSYHLVYVPPNKRHLELRENIT